MKIIRSYTTKNDGYRGNGRLVPKGIMIHSTATPGIMAKAFRERFNKPGLGKSVHGFVDDTCYVQCLPYDKKAGHCRYGGNSTHIGIELCEPKAWRTDTAYFEKVYANGAALTAQLCLQFGIPASKVIDHAEGYALGIASNHSDVGHWFPLFGKDMDSFRAAVGALLAAAAERIRELQGVLNLAYDAGLACDGKFGPHTKAAVNAHLLRKRSPLSKGEYVFWVQQQLLRKGYSIGKWGADGSFGGATRKGVIAFQKEMGIATDGIVGPETVLLLCL